MRATASQEAVLMCVATSLPDQPRALDQGQATRIDIEKQPSTGPTGSKWPRLPPPHTASCEAVPYQPVFTANHGHPAEFGYLTKTWIAHLTHEVSLAHTDAASGP